MCYFLNAPRARVCHVLSISFSLLALPAQVQAQPQAPMEQVVVTTPLHKTAAETALPVTVLRGEALLRESAATLGETLSRSPGLSNASFGPGVGQPVIRGQQGPRVRVLQNSLGTGDTAANSADHANTAEPLLAESIEVLRGPATLLYGSGAIGGVVNVIDGRIPSTVPEAPEVAAAYRHDSAADTDVAVGRASAGGNGVVWYLDGLYREWNNLDIPGWAVDTRALESDHEDHEHEQEHEEEAEAPANTRSYIANTDGHSHSGTFGLSKVFSQGFIGIAVNRLENEYGIPPGGHSHAGHGADEHHEEEHGDEEHGDEVHGEEVHGEEEHGEEEHGDEHAAEAHNDGIRIDLEQTRYDLAAQWQAPFAGAEALRYRLAYTDYEHTELEGGVPGTVFTNERWEQRMELIHGPLFGWHGVVGLQWESRDFAARGEESFVPASDIDALGLFLVEDYHWEHWTLELGARINRDEVSTRQSGDKRFTSLSASAAALWRFQPGWQLGLALTRAERAPTVEELFANAGLDELDHCVIHGATGACELGSADLGEERSNNADLTLSFERAGWEGFVTVFYNDFDDYIDLLNTGQVLEPAEAPVLRYRQSDARFTGVEWSLSAPLWEAGERALTATVSGDVIDGELDSGADVPRLPPLRVGAELRYRHRAWQGYVQVMDADEQDSPGEHETPTAGYTRWDAGVEYGFAGPGHAEYRIYLRGKNLTDETIRLSTSFLRNYAPEPGRSLEIGLRIEW